MSGAGRLVEVRPATAEEMDDFAYVTHTTLASHGRSHYDPMRDMRPEWTLCAFEDGALVTSSGAWPFSMRFNGERIAVAGVTAVGTLPHKRRRGYLGRTMLASFVRQHEAGQAIAILHASLAAIYQRYGYAVVAGAWDYAIDPRDLRLRGGREAAAGTVRLSDKRELPLLKEIYRAYAGPRTGLLHRGEALWETGPLAQADPQEGPIYAAIYEEEGQALGYALYTTRDPGDGEAGRNHLLTVREVGWLSAAAYVALWEHLASHDLVTEIRWHGAPEDDPLRQLVEEPRALQARWHDGIMLRIVDVETALPVRPYGQAAELTFELFDAQCGWNQGVWRLETDGAQSRLGRTGGEAGVRLDVQALGALASGALSATALARQGRLKAVDERSLGEWDRTFATAYRPECLNYF